MSDTRLLGASGRESRAMALAKKLAANASATNFDLTHALPRIAELGRDAGLFMESLMAGIAQSEPEAKARMHTFLAHGTGEVVANTP